MKTIFITGGTGFLGRNLAKKLKKDYHVVLGGRNNTQNMLAKIETGCDIYPLDIVNIESVRDAFRKIKPNIVIHAAATKFVDLSEQFPFEAIDVNVLGSENVARACLDFEIESVIGISTDKAAPPVGNTYAMTKALMERLYCSLNSYSDTKFCCVRFGNIAWSSGSVFPIWKKMIKNSGVIESTGSDMRHFFISADQASDIVIKALDDIEALQGKILIKDMKAAQIRTILDVWTKHLGGEWKPIAARLPGNKIDQLLFGESEIPYTMEWMSEGKKYFVLSFNQKAEKPVQSVISSANADNLTEEEILHILTSYPDEFK